ncbi:MAG: cyclic nucleotide-binding domain-containing protein [Fibrobacterota bacterium]
MSALLKSYSPSEIIFREGMPGSSTYVVQSGKVEISVQRDGRKVVLAMLGEGALFGEMATIDGGLRSATASASTAADVYCIRSDGFRQMIDECPPFVKTMVDSLISRVRKVNTKLASTASMESWLACAHLIDLLARLRPANKDAESVVVNVSQVMERLPEILGISVPDTMDVLHAMAAAHLMTVSDGENGQIVVTQFKSFLSRVRIALRIAAGRQHETKEAAP